MMCSYRETEVTRESYWGSHLGELKQIKDLSDTHIINLINYVQQYPMYYGPQFLEVFQAEATLRNLQDKMKERAQIPYQDHRGQWWIWNFETGRPEVVGGKMNALERMDEQARRTLKELDDQDKPWHWRVFAKLFGSGDPS